MAVTFENGVIKTEDLVFNEDLGGVGHLYFRFMRKYEDRLAQIDAENGEKDTYSSLLKKCIRTALTLKEKGIKKGDVIVLCSSHHLNACVPLIAAQFLGALPSCIFVPDCLNLFSDIKPKVIFTQKINESTIKAALQSYNLKSEIVVFEDNFEKEFLSTKPGEDSFEPIYIQDLSETGYIFGTSGTTGPPKAIFVKHYSIIIFAETNLKLKDQSAANDNSERVVFLSYSKWGWISADLILFASAIFGACRILSNNFDAFKFWKYVEHYKVSASLVGSQYIPDLYENGIPDGVDISSIKSIICSGEVFAGVHVSNFRKVFPRILLLQSLSSTEAPSIFKFLPGNPLHIKYLMEKPASTGFPVKGMWYKVIDLDTGKPLGCNQFGELCIKSKQLLNGYSNHNMSAYYDEDGFFKTGDVVYFDEDYCFYFVQRLIDVVQYRGKRVFPFITYNVLLTHPAVKNALVIPKKTGTVDGDLLMAFVILSKNFKETTKEELEGFVNYNVREEQKIRGGIFFVNSFPYIYNGKYNKRLLKEIASRDNVGDLKTVYTFLT